LIKEGDEEKKETKEEEREKKEEKKEQTKMSISRPFSWYRIAYQQTQG